jgi:hypothetical protein
MFRTASRSLLVLTLGLTLSTTATAAPIRWSAFLPEGGSGVLQLLETVLQGRSGVAPKRGCGVDPDGQPTCAPVPADTKRGCTVDPNGQPICAPVPADPKRRCGIDPNGNQVCTP